MFNKLSTRQRAVFTAIFSTFILFVLISPFGKLIYDLVAVPGSVRNVVAIQKTKEIDMAWEKNGEYDLAGYKITKNGEVINDKILANIDVDKYGIYNLEDDQEYTIAISAYDQSGNSSTQIEFKITPSVQTKTFVYNPFDDSASNLKTILANIFIASVVLLILNYWVLFYKVTRKTFLTIAAFPSITMVSYLILSISILFTINNQFNKVIFSIGICGLYFIINYLLLLTTNILNGAQSLGQLPLEQAAKAAQFIFSLISTYLMLIYIFSTNFNFIVRLVILLMLIFYFTYSSLSSIRELPEFQITIKTVAILCVMTIAIVVFSVWPIDSVYGILGIAVIYYILLNIALEVRNKVGRSLWIEYSILIALISLLLATNSIWGIRGTLI